MTRQPRDVTYLFRKDTLTFALLQNEFDGDNRRLRLQWCALNTCFTVRDRSSEFA